MFEHPGRQTFGASVFVAARGGTIVTCAATSGYMIEYDNRHLWMKLKRIVSSHFANYAEAWAANQLICEGKIQPMLSAVYPLDEVGEAAYQVHHNLHEGKIGVLCLAPEEGLGIDDPEFREQVGEDKITLFRAAQPAMSPLTARMPGDDDAEQVAAGSAEVAPLLTEIDHVAIAVHDLGAAIDYYRETFGALVDHREVVESDGVEEALLKVAD